MVNLHKLLSGQGIMIKDDDIVDVCHHFPNISPENYKKLEKAYNKQKEVRLKLSEEEMIGNGNGVPKIVKKVGRVARKTEQAVMKSRIGDLLIDEAVGFLSIPTIAQKVVAGVVKKEAYELNGTGFDASVDTDEISHVQINNS